MNVEPPPPPPEPTLPPKGIKIPFSVPKTESRPRYIHTGTAEVEGGVSVYRFMPLVSIYKIEPC